MDDYSEGFWNGIMATVTVIMLAGILILIGILIGSSI